MLITTSRPPPVQRPVGGCSRLATRMAAFCRGAVLWARSRTCCDPVKGEPGPDEPVAAAVLGQQPPSLTRITPQPHVYHQYDTMKRTNVCNCVGGGGNYRRCPHLSQVNTCSGLKYRCQCASLARSTNLFFFPPALSSTRFLHGGPHGNNRHDRHAHAHSLKGNYS